MAQKSKDWDINDSQFPRLQTKFCYDAWEEWPDGHCRYVYQEGCEEAKKHSSGWAMRNTNNHNVNILKKSCLGVLVCSKRCIQKNGKPVTIRPAICDKARKKQQGKVCPNLTCDGILEIQPCRGHGGYPVTHFWRHVPSLGILFQAKGFHDHHKPSTKSSATSLKRKGTAKRSLPTSSSAKVLSQTFDISYKVEPDAVPSVQAHCHGPPQNYWWDHPEAIQPVHGFPARMEMESFDKHAHEPYHHPPHVGASAVHPTSSPPSTSSIANGGIPAMHPGHQIDGSANAIAMDLTNELWLHANASAAVAAAAATHHNGDFDAYHHIKEPQPQPPPHHHHQFNNNSIDFLTAASGRNQFDPYDLEYHSNGEFIEHHGQPQYEFYEASSAASASGGPPQPPFDHHQSFAGAYTSFHGVNDYHIHNHVHHPDEHLVKTFSV